MRILEIVRNVQKQKVDISSILNDVRDRQAGDDDVDDDDADMWIIIITTIMENCYMSPVMFDNDTCRSQSEVDFCLLEAQTFVL